MKRTLLHLDKKYLNNYVYRSLRPRRTHLYCTGTMKSGTHSINYIFDRALRNAHEPDREQLLNIFFEKRSKNISEDRLKDLVSTREKRLYLELNSSCYNYIIIEELLDLYPDAKFIHPIREPYSWLDSWLNHELNHQSCEIQQYTLRSYHREIFKKDSISYRKEEKILEDLQLPTIEGMLSYWREHNLKILQTVPEERIFVLRTKDISNKIDSIIEFAGLGHVPGKYRNSHAYKAKEEHNILSEIDSSFLEKIISKYAIDLNKWL